MTSRRWRNARFWPFGFYILSRWDSISASNGPRAALNSTRGDAVVMTNFARRLTVVENFVISETRVIEPDPIVQCLSQAFIFNLKIT